MFTKLIFLAISIFIASSSVAMSKGKYFHRAILVIFENTDYSYAIKQPFFKRLADNGALFTNFSTITHPSQPNYIALTSGSLHGVSHDGTVNLNVNNIVDLLEKKGVTWKVYAEQYPEKCFTGASKAGYVRKHNPFISYLNIQKNPLRCANIVNANKFDLDVKNGQLPEYIFYVPDEQNNGHDTNASYADTWYEQKFSNYVSDPQFMKDTILITTFDESAFGFNKKIYTSIIGPSVLTGRYSDSLNHYSLLKLIEENWSLGTLGKEDLTATSLPEIWK